MTRPAKNPAAPSTRTRFDSLNEIFAGAEPGMQELFVKVINLHAAMQIQERTQSQQIALVRQHIEQSLDQRGSP